jgi:predicted RecB family nuclease
MRLLDGQLVLSPSDLTKFTRCAHVTTLDLGRLNKTLKPLAYPQRSLHTDFIAEKGTEHEKDHVERLARAGNRVLRIEGDRKTAEDLRNAAQATIDAMKSGAAYIYQAVFFDGKWVGYADLLEKVGDGRYEVIDIKLARSPKAHVLLQLAAYSEHLTRIQGVRPEKMHIILGTNEKKSFKVVDFEAYYRHVKQRFTSVLSPQSSVLTFPYIIDFCSLCEWNMHCWRTLEQQDHLVRVANIRRDEVRRLEGADIKTLTKLGDTPGARIEKVRGETYARLHQQARLQSQYARTKIHKYELLAPEVERGFALMPRPSKGDVFLDLEADPYAAGGITYLFGIATSDGAYRSWWAHDALQEKEAFEKVIDFIVDRRREHPDLHVYHYTAAEPSAFKRMSSEYGTRENEIDDWLRAGVFVDFFTVVRQAMRISQPSYSLKKLEAFYFNREEEGVFEKGGPILAYEEWLENRDDATLKIIENYNKEDCVSMVELQKWLLQLRGDAPWFESPPPEEKEDPIDDLTRAVMEKSELLANLLQYHRREDRPAWWWYFGRLKMWPEELKDDHESIGGLTLATDIPTRSVKKSTIYTLRFPAQEHKLTAEKDVIDPATKKHINIVSIDNENGLLEIKRGNASKEPFPAALIPNGPLETKKHRAAIRRLAQSVLDNDSRYQAAVDILERRPLKTPRPAERGEGGPAKRDRVRGSAYLFVQGPPGSGKTYWGSHEIVKLLAEGKRVGVTSNSHKAIHNLLDEVERVAKERGVKFAGLKKCTEDKPETEYRGTFIASSDKIDDFLDPNVRLIAGTSWLFADARFDQTLDDLFIDEAGQVALANALAVALSACRVVLLGDPLQLAQVSQAVHPGTSGSSVLEHLLGTDATIPPDRGLFLEHTWRMHPDVCRFISEVVYDGRLESAPECANRDTSSGTGLRFIAMEHEGNSQSSVEEAERIADEIAKLLGHSVTDEKCVTRPIRQTDIMVVAPYNAQVRCVLDVLRKRGFADVPVGTVDKFQGRQAEVVFFSMATSSGDDLPRDIDFLFSRNRLNVAISRARCLAVVVASPRLLDVACHTPEQMQLVNALCRFVEMAQSELAGAQRLASQAKDAF